MDCLSICLVFPYGHAPLDRFMLRLRIVLSSPGLAKASLIHIEHKYNYSQLVFHVILWDAGRKHSPLPYLLFQTQLLITIAFREGSLAGNCHQDKEE